MANVEPSTVKVPVGALFVEVMAKVLPPDTVRLPDPVRAPLRVTFPVVVSMVELVLSFKVTALPMVRPDSVAAARVPPERVKEDGVPETLLRAKAPPETSTEELVLSTKVRVVAVTSPASTFRVPAVASEPFPAALPRVRESVVKPCVFEVSSTILGVTTSEPDSTVTDESSEP
jgi:hypothetical protein